MKSKIPIEEKILVLAKAIAGDVVDIETRWAQMAYRGRGRDGRYLKKMDEYQDNILKRTKLMCDLLMEYPNRKDIGSLVNCYIKSLRPVMTNIAEKLDPKY